MQKTILTLLSCMFLAACAAPLAETGISRSRAIYIAESNSKYYPDRYSYVDRAVWNPGARHWEVTLADHTSDHGQHFTISRHGNVISAKKFSYDRSRRYDDGYYGRHYYY